MEQYQEFVGAVVLGAAVVLLLLAYIIWRSLRALIGIERGVWAVVSQLKAERHGHQDSAASMPAEVKTSIRGGIQRISS